MITVKRTTKKETCQSGCTISRNTIFVYSDAGDKICLTCLAKKIGEVYGELCDEKLKR